MGLPVVQKLWTPREAHTKKNRVRAREFPENAARYVRPQTGGTRRKRRNLLVQERMNGDGENTCLPAAKRFRGILGKS